MLDHSVAEAAPQNVHSFRKWWEVLVLLHYLIQGGRPGADNGIRFPDEFIQSAGILRLDGCDLPQQTNKTSGATNCRH